jgi:hypothetical protein
LIVAVPVCVSLVAVIVTDPTATAVTSPELELTDAMLVFPLDQVTTRPLSTLLFASRVVADNCVVAPTTTFDEDGETVTVATGTGAGTVTVMLALPVFVSLVAVIVADPAPTAVTRPVVEFTEATPEFPLDHATTRPVRTLLLASRVVADN